MHFAFFLFFYSNIADHIYETISSCYINLLFSYMFVNIIVSSCIHIYFSFHSPPAGPAARPPFANLITRIFVENLVKKYRWTTWWRALFRWILRYGKVKFRSRIESFLFELKFSCFGRSFYLEFFESQSVFGGPDVGRSKNNDTFV